MNIHWHALAEQLQQHPDLLEEELQGEVAAMSAQAEVQSAPKKELEVLQRLQRRLGNHAVQRLLSGRNPVVEVPAVAKPVVEAAPAEAARGALPETESAVELTSETMHETVSETTSEVTPEPALEPAAASRPEPVAVDTRKQLHGLLRRMLWQLPRLDVAALETFAELFDQQSPALQASIIAMLVSRSQALPEADQKEFLQEIRKLSGSIAGSRLICALLARLLAVVPSHPAAVVEPEPAEE